MKEIILSDNQFKALLKMVYLGSWMANSFREEPIPELESIEQYIYSFASEFGCGHLIGHDSESREYVPTDSFVSIMDVLVDDYNDETMWEELAYLLARRDVIRSFGEKKVSAMCEKELFKAEDPLVEKYYREFEKNGIMNLHFKG